MRFNIDKYDPANDSSKGTGGKTRGDFDGVILKVDTERGDCKCGCTEQPTSAKRSFRMGHDARLKGVLIRAHLAGVKVKVIDKGGKGSARTAMAVATELGWGSYLVNAAERMANKPERKAPKAKGPKVGDAVEVKIGRATYGALIRGVFPDGDGTAKVDYEYTNGKGELKVVTRTVKVA